MCNLNRSLGTPFKVEEINEGIKVLLQHDWFDMNFAGSDDERDSDDEDKLRCLKWQIHKKARYSKKKQSILDLDD